MNTLQTSRPMTTFGWLVKREYWESRRGFLWAQVWAAAAILILTVLGMIAGEVWNAHMHGDSVPQMGISLDRILQSASSHDMIDLVKGLDATMSAFAVIAGIVLSFVVFFYLLGALYDDRRDRSLLFWKSLPISDSGTVLSKVVSAVVIAPLFALGMVLAGYVGLQIIVSLWLLIHGVNPFPLLWAHAEPFGVWLRLLVTIPVSALWALPTVGWLLLWSSAVRSKPFLWALLIPIVIGVLNIWIGLLRLPHIDVAFYWRNLFGRALFSIIPGSWVAPQLGGSGIGGYVPHGHMVQEGLLNFAAMGRALTTPDMWIGAAVGVVLIAAAIWFRRWRDEA